VTRRLKAGIGKVREIARQRAANGFPPQRLRDATIEKMLEAMFSVLSVPTLYNVWQSERLRRSARVQ
jgi:hypothetical protein